MSLIASNKPKEYELCPKGREVPIICCDVEQPETKKYPKTYAKGHPRAGQVIPNQFDDVEQVRFLYLSGGPRMQDGRPFMLRAQFGLNMGPGKDGRGSPLRRYMGLWRGEPFSDEEVAPPGIELEPWAIGRVGKANIVWNPDKKDPQKLWVNIDLLQPLEDPVITAMLKDLLVGYVRMKDREKTPEQMALEMQRQAQQMLDADSVPF